MNNSHYLSIKIFFKEFIDLVPKKNIQLYTILWNGDFDYALYLKEIKQIHKKYNSFKIITQNNFYKIIIYLLIDLNYQKKKFKRNFRNKFLPKNKIFQSFVIFSIQFFKIF